MSEPIVLVSIENIRITFDPRVIEFSALLRDIVADNPPGEEIPVKRPAVYLAKIKDYLENHQYQAPPVIPAPLTQESLNAISKWDTEFVDSFSRDDFQNFYDVVDYLQIPSLSDLCGASIAKWFKGKDIRSIQQEFGLPELTTEIEVKLQTENKWAIDNTLTR